MKNIEVPVTTVLVPAPVPASQHHAVIETSGHGFSQMSWGA